MLTVVFLLLGIAAATRAQSLNATTCADVQIFIAVGHGENFPGNQLSIAQAVCKGRSSCAYSNINFASTSSASYCTVAVQGINSGVATLAAYAQKCPKSKIVVSGWSQGAQVVTDIISGGGGVGQGSIAAGCTQQTTTPLSPTTSPGNQIVAVTVYGNPRHNAGQSFNIGPASNANGAWPRKGTQLTAENLWASKLRDYCATGDPACANGTNWSAHGSYFGSYAATPAAFINSMLATTATPSPSTRFRS